jgi:hypothetical protein
MKLGPSLLPAAAFLAALASTPLQAQQPGAPGQSQPSQPQAGSQAPGDDKPGVVFASIISAQATVADIDKANRMLLLRTDDGREFAVKAGPEVKNFDQIQKGDKVTAQYHEATAIFVRKPEAAAGAPSGAAPPGPMQYGTAEVAPPGQKPAGVVANVTEITATVQDVDYNTRQVTLRGPEGKLRTVKVGDRVQNLQNITKGDQVVLRHTEALAIAVAKSS